MNKTALSLLKYVAQNGDDSLLLLQFRTSLLELIAIAEEVERAKQFHPRAMKLISKEKNFVVVAEDEPYYMEVYKMIRLHEKDKNRWTEVDEVIFQKALEGK